MFVVIKIFILRHSKYIMHCHAIAGMMDPLIRAILFGASIALNMSIYNDRIDTQNHVLISSIALCCNAALVVAYQGMWSLYTLITSRKHMTHPDYSDDEMTAFDRESAFPKSDSSATFVIDEEGELQSETEAHEEAREEAQEEARQQVLEKQDRQMGSERRLSVWRDIYGLGLASFVIFYCSDMISLLPSLFFLLGIFICSVVDSAVIVDVDKDVTEYMGIKRCFTLTIQVFMLMAWFCAGLSILEMKADVFRDALGKESLLNILLSYAMPLIAPLVVKTAARPNMSFTDTRRVITNAYPLTVFTALWYLLSTLACSSRFQTMSTYLSAEKIALFLLLTGVKSCAAVALISAFLSKKNTEVLAMLGLILFSKEYAFSQKVHSGSLMLPALVLAATATLLTFFKYSPRCIHLVASWSSPVNVESGRL